METIEITSFGAPNVLQPGERPVPGVGEWLIRASASGIKRLGERVCALVIVTAGSDEKCAACLALGANHAINYKTHDFHDEVARLTGG